VHPLLSNYSTQVPRVQVELHIANVVSAERRCRDAEGKGGVSAAMCRDDVASHCCSLSLLSLPFVTSSILTQRSKLVASIANFGVASEPTQAHKPLKNILSAEYESSIFGERYPLNPPPVGKSFQTRNPGLLGRFKIRCFAQNSGRVEDGRCFRC